MTRFEKILLVVAVLLLLRSFGDRPSGVSTPFPPGSNYALLVDEGGLGEVRSMVIAKKVEDALEDYIYFVVDEEQTLDSFSVWGKAKEQAEEFGVPSIVISGARTYCGEVPETSEKLAELLKECAL